MKPKYDFDKIYKLYESGVEIAEIAATCESKYAMIWQILMRSGRLKRHGNRRLRLKIGQRFGMLEILGVHSVKGKTTWKVRCDCGTEKIVRGTSLSLGTTKSCGCNIAKHRDTHGLWSGYEEISGSFWSKLKWSAERRGLSVMVSKEYVWKLFLAQGRKCAISNIPIKFAEDAVGQVHGQTTASLDRIDSDGDYVEGNVWWVHKMVNRMKWGLPLRAFLGLCRRIAEVNPRECIK